MLISIRIEKLLDLFFGTLAILSSFWASFLPLFWVSTMHDDSFSLPPAYDPKETDATWYRFWEEGEFFRADPASTKEPYTILMPPPNVTGVLHMGHALVTTLQDILIRYKRMRGYEALWIPGTDHAGIATQMVVERNLHTEGKRRTDYSREDFIKIVWEWKERYESRIIGQLQALGASCDWNRKRFTMDEGCSHAVRVMFKKLYDAGLIYQGDYLVNWDPVAQTALADDELEYEEVEGSLWHFNFPLEGGSGHITIATTRPETMLGDVAVAVSPKDERYTHLVHKTILHPLTGRSIPIIADAFVDPLFGTGAVKLTPAHDPTDYRIAPHHNLPMINILTPDGRINENGGLYTGLTREEARTKIVAAMKERGLLAKIEPHRLRTAHSYRSKAVIEPYLSKQWFIKMDPFVEELKAAVNEGRVNVVPELWRQTYFHWITHLRDWCISRQLWWGHRIPVWHHKSDPARKICSDQPAAPEEVRNNPDQWEQDSDVLDTWFSSALWPLSTLGWPEKTEELQKFYPTSVLVTGHDILFFWVARMIMMGTYAMDKVPFHATFLHGLIYGKSYFRKAADGTLSYIAGEERESYDLGKPLPSDIQSKWEKLSKSKGNAIDPLDLIATYGTDAVRMALASCANQTPQIDLDRRRFEEFKHFANKIWNGARFVFMNLEGLQSHHLAEGLDTSPLLLEDRWILSQLHKTVDEVNKALEEYHFDHASELAYNFFWKELCAYFVEIAKPVLSGRHGTPQEKLHKQKLLVILLNQALRLLHPIAPFITEELFQRLKKRFPHLSPTSEPLMQESIAALMAPACIVAPYPKPMGTIDSSAIEQFELFECIVQKVRAIRGEMKIPPQTPIVLYLVGHCKKLKEGAHILSALLRLEALHILPESPILSGLVAKGTMGDITLLIPLPPDLALKERTRLEKEEAKLKTRLTALQTAYENPDFLAKATAEVIAKQKASLDELTHSLAAIEEKLREF